jgi:hypothetical protein
MAGIGLPLRKKRLGSILFRRGRFPDLIKKIANQN